MGQKMQLRFLPPQRLSPTSMMREHILDSSSGSRAQPKQRRRPKSKGSESAESAENRRKREATAARAATLRRCKQQLDSVTNDKYDLGELVQKGFGNPCVSGVQPRSRSSGLRR